MGSSPEHPQEGFGLRIENYLPGISSPNAKRFFSQVFSQDFSTYLDRLDAIGFLGLNRVLDVGCGYGQWSVVLANFSGRVDAIDTDYERVTTLQKIAVDLSIRNLSATLQSIDEIDPSDKYDGIFCYSALYYSDFRESITRLASCLAPGGLLYIQTNDLGWYIYNLLNSHNEAEDFSGRDFAVSVIENTINFYSGVDRNPNIPVVTPMYSVMKHLEKEGLVIIGHGGDGSVSVSGRMGKSFYDPEYLGQISVFEVLCRKELESE